jgi:hypothetical protein
MVKWVWDGYIPKLRVNLSPGDGHEASSLVPQHPHYAAASTAAGAGAGAGGFGGAGSQPSQRGKVEHWVDSSRKMRPKEKNARGRRKVGGRQAHDHSHGGGGGRRGRSLKVGGGGARRAAARAVRSHSQPPPPHACVCGRKTGSATLLTEHHVHCRVYGAQQRCVKVLKLVAPPKIPGPFFHVCRKRCKRCRKRCKRCERCGRCLNVRWCGDSRSQFLLCYRRCDVIAGNFRCVCDRVFQAAPTFATHTATCAVVLLAKASEASVPQPTADTPTRQQSLLEGGR